MNRPERLIAFAIVALCTGTAGAQLEQQRPDEVAEAAKFEAFLAEMRGTAPYRRSVEVVDEEDRADAVATSTRAVLAANASIAAVYSMYAGAGGNAAVVDAFDAAGRRYAVFVAHDLDGENTPLLRQRRLSAVLHHDLRQDLRRACHVVMQAQGALPGPVRSTPSAIQDITPHNAPPVLFGWE